MHCCSAPTAATPAPCNPQGLCAALSADFPLPHLTPPALPCPPPSPCSCKLNAELKGYRTDHRLLLTGTPLQASDSGLAVVLHCCGSELAHTLSLLVAMPLGIVHPTHTYPAQPPLAPRSPPPSLHACPCACPPCPLTACPLHPCTLVCRRTTCLSCGACLTSWCPTCSTLGRTSRPGALLGSALAG